MSYIIPFPRNAQSHKQDLRAALQSMQELQIGGYRVEQGESNCVVVLHNGHVLGLWHWGDGYYHYTPTSYGRPTFKTGRRWQEPDVLWASVRHSVSLTEQMRANAAGNPLNMATMLSP